MKRVATAAVLIPLVLAAVLFAPAWVLVLTVGAVAMLAANEFLRMAHGLGMAPYRRTVLALLGIGFLNGAAAFAWAEHPEEAVAPLVIAGIFLLPLAFLLAGMRKPDLRQSVAAASVSYLTFFYIAFPLAALIAIRQIQPAGAYLLCLILVMVWVGDIAALYVGRAIGKHKLAPRISPGKTVEGAIGSLILTVAVCWGLVQFALPRLPLPHDSFYFFVAPPVWVPLVLGIGVNLAAQLGDLVESMIKRGAGVKDSGALLPGHGGVLDRIDALLLAAPVAMLILVLTRESFLRTR